MKTENKKDKPGVINQIIVAIVLALAVGGSSPWWWNEFFSSKNGVGATATGQESRNGALDKEDSIEKTDSKIWKEGKLIIPVSTSNSGSVADLDNGKLLPLGTSISAAGADILIRQSIHSIVLEPGLSKGDGITFDARFLTVNDHSVGKDGCSASLVSPEASNHLQLSSDIDIGSHICMVTSEGRIAELNITKLNFTGNSRNAEIEYVVWQKE